MTNLEHVAPLIAKNLHAMDSGDLGRAIDHAIRQIQQDILSRPFNAEGKSEKRKLQITLEFEPETEFDAQTKTRELEKISVETIVKVALPALIGNKHDVRLNAGHLAFNPEIPHAFFQPSLFNEDDYADES